MDSDGNWLLNDDEKQLLLTAREELQTARDSGDAEVVKEAIKSLEKAAEFYVARRMDSNIQSVMSGHNITEFES